MTDKREKKYGLNPNNPDDQNKDTDGDGLSNFHEYIAGTNPASRQDVLKFEILSPSQSRMFGGFRFTAVSNRTYTIQQLLSIPGTWQSFSNILAAPTNRVIELTNTASPAIRFYRIVTPQVQ